MRIHTVKEGDTIFKIARAYSLPPAKIIENNALVTPDRLYPGQKLVILTPTRSYTVRGGDTLENIALRFGTDKKSLKKNNPALMGEEKIYPGQILAVRYDAKKFGNCVVNACLSGESEREKLSLFLPYLTYLTFSAAKWERGRLLRLFDYTDSLNNIKNKSIIPVLRVYTENCVKELSEDKEEFLNSIVSVAKRDGFSAVSLAAYRAMKENEEFKTFFKELKCELHKSGLELHTEFDGNSDITAYKELSEIADVAVLNYEKGETSSIPDFNSGEKKLLRSYRDECQHQKCLVDLSLFAYLGGEPQNFQEIERLIRTRGISPQYSESAKCCHFALNRYSGGKREEIFVSFPSPENTKAKLELLGELGYMGVSFDIMRTPVQHLMMFNSLFHCEKPSRSGMNSCRGED
ncbi:MAG: LysM peptidoglycan-binding domain-containing protein [Clostridia bacterium]|nr:LysM peptidoglycan-binding domain-containing protein [Clostridia bacterium]